MRDVSEAQRRTAERAAARILADLPGIIAAGRAMGGDVGAVAALALLFGELSRRGVLPAELRDPGPTPEVLA